MSPEPFVPAPVSRRHFLSLSVTALMGLTACTTGVLDPPGLGVRPSGGGSPIPEVPTGAADFTGSAGTSFTYLAPFAASPDSSLSQDYFLLTPGLFDPNTDEVVAYVHDDSGALEAMIIQDTILSQLYHDPAQNGAWALAPVKIGDTDLDGVVDVVAGRALDAKNQIGQVGSLHVFCRTADAVLHLVQAPDRTWTSTNLNWPVYGNVQPVPPLQLSSDPDGGLFAYWFSGQTFTVNLNWCRVTATSTEEMVYTGVAKFGFPPGTQFSGLARMSRANGQLQIWTFLNTGYVSSAYLIDVDLNASSPQTGAPKPLNPANGLQLAGGLGAVNFHAVFAMDETQPPYVVAESVKGALYLLTYDPDTTDSTHPWHWQSIWSVPTNWQQDRVFAGIRGLTQSESTNRAARADKVLTSTSCSLIRRCRPSRCGCCVRRPPVTRSPTPRHRCSARRFRCRAGRPPRHCRPPAEPARG